jgi:F0F1-type ATP synthase delta subunit
MSSELSVLTAAFTKAEQLDLLYLSLINLMDMVKDGEVDLVLDQEGKSTKQKQLFLDKMVAGVQSVELATHLKSQPMDFFYEKNLGPFLQQLKREADQFEIVRLTVAVVFKEKDLKEMATFLSEKLGKPTVLSIKLDKNLFGGVIVQHGSFQSDFSVHTQLDIFRSRWHRAVVSQ